ncbi:MAG: DNA-directed DNA polymerase II small subunit [Euryarchaeota archaeon]|nr:DNA-directed DNA polymerase II small subunit [Euryarchaeota archaeon]
MRDELVEALASEGILLEPEAVQFILSKSDPLAFTRAALSTMAQQPLIITLEDLRSVAPVAETYQAMEAIVEKLPDPAPLRRELGEIKVLRDITGNSTCEGSIADFARYFSNRFKKIKGMLARRRELVGCLPVPRALRMSREVRIVVMVNEVRTTKNGHKILEVEDDEGKCLVLIPKDSLLISESIVPDEVIGIVGKTSQKGDLVVLNELIRPDIPLRGVGMQPSDSSASVAFLSDVHVGSNTFLHQQWNNMIHWLRTEGRDRIHYLVLPGDIVDGIGVFPGQEDELEIENIFEQYGTLAEMLKEVPDDIRIVIQPGNHDAVRPAEPQPAFSKHISDMFDSSTLFVGNPCYLEIEDRTILSYHGRSIDDWISNVQGLSYDHPLEAMKEMLKRRHLAPIYGGKTPLAPEKEDYLVIDEVPDIFVAGHVHGAGFMDYRGVKVICASTWQAQTSFQRMHNFHPAPAKMPVVHLGTGMVDMLDFN